MPLSSNSLIHLTDTEEKLKLIIQEGFKVKYCNEKINTSENPTFNAFIPMVSFCDIPLSEIKNHISAYGEYGLGLKKNWGKKHGLNPVLYIDIDSRIGNTFTAIIKNMFKGKKIKELTEDETSLANIFRYMKNYEGTLTRKDKTINKYRFSDEREWRYVPEPKDAHLLFAAKTIDSDDKKNYINTSIGDLRLTFELEDINYLILRDESEISAFIKWIQIEKSDSLTNSAMLKLTSRIITVNQILFDF
jgi:hypothetical protein